MATAWPDAAAFREAFQNPRTCFVDEELRESRIVQDRRGFPLVYSGNFASVFKVQSEAKTLAVRCFLRDVGDRERRYKAIEDHLARVRASAITHFEYVNEGIRIRGRPYPLLIMDWVEGYTLDQYVRSNAASAETFRALAQRWLQVVSELEQATIGHGDLQHGNILVSSGDLKLVDYDGMYVPALSGLASTETGHRAYQHPARTARDFGADIDRFSTLVVYLSLAAFAANPRLAKLCSGDRLLLEAADYRNPKASQTFGELQRLNGTIKKVTEVLQEACSAPIQRVPRLLDLVEVAPASKLPNWMRAESAIPTPTQIQIEPPRNATSAPAATPVEPIPVTVLTGATSSTAAQTATRQAPAPRRTFDGAAFASGCFVWALVSLFGLAGMLRIPPEAALTIFLAGTAVIAAHNYRRPAQTPQPRTYSPPPQRPFPTWQPPTPTSTSSGAVVGSAIRTKYHRPSCEWARKMSSRNRIHFASAADARAKGYRPCRVCRP